MNISYKNPILVEQFAELYLAKGSLSAEKVIHFVPHIEAVGFNQIEMANIEEFSLNLAPGRPDSLNRTATTPRIRCWNKDKNKLIQLFEDRIVVHQVGQYLGWDEFRSLFEQTLNICSSQLSNFKTESVVFQTIDQFEVDSKDFVFSKYLSCDGSIFPAWYKDEKSSGDLTLGKGLLNEEGKNRQIHASIRKTAEKTIVNLRCVFQSLLQNGTPMKLLENLHEESNKTFEAMITEHTRTNVMMGTK